MEGHLGLRSEGIGSIVLSSCVELVVSKVVLVRVSSEVWSDSAGVTATGTTRYANSGHPTKAQLAGSAAMQMVVR